MRLTVVRVSAALVAFGIATISAAANDRATCNRPWDVEAVVACSRLISGNPDDAVFYWSRGHAYWNRQDYDRGIADYDQAIQLNPKHPLWGSMRYAFAYYGRNEAYRAKGDIADVLFDSGFSMLRWK